MRSNRKDADVAQEIHVHAGVLAQLARNAGLEVVAYLLEWAADESGAGRDTSNPKRIM